MRVKEAVLTFVAMGGFAVPVLFQSPASDTTSAETPSVTVPDNRQPLRKA
ncbi:hypothetical protein [Paenirhodobacter sp.]